MANRRLGRNRAFIGLHLQRVPGCCCSLATKQDKHKQQCPAPHQNLYLSPIKRL
uniref:Uncharacterized protein n=1 Tax=Rheinheimera sp. BAL341 TaxID=1708203 RepID=A0A486XX76_9GAMM